MSDLAEKLTQLPRGQVRISRAALFTDDELRDLIAAQDDGVTASVLFAAVGRSRNLAAFRQILQGARKRLNLNGKASA